MKLDSAVAIVTGGASGLGEATVRTIVAGGGRAVILDRPNSPGEELAGELGAKSAIFAARRRHLGGAKCKAAVDTRGRDVRQGQRLRELRRRRHRGPHASASRVRTRSTCSTWCCR